MIQGASRFVGFVPVSDLDRARQFYVDTLGLPLIDEEYGLLLDAGGAALRVVPVEEVRVQTGTTAGWDVDDVEATVGALTARGVTFSQIWASPSGSRVAWFQDPDGNTLSLTQSAG